MPRPYGDLSKVKKIEHKPLTPIPLVGLPKMINKPVHLASAPHQGCVWVLDRITDDGVMYLHTPHTNKKLRALASEAYYVRRLDPNGWY